MKKDCVKVPQGSYMRDLHNHIKEFPKTSWVSPHVFDSLKGLADLNQHGVSRIQHYFGKISSEKGAILQFEQIGTLIAKTLTRHGKDEGK